MFNKFVLSTATLAVIGFSGAAFAHCGSCGETDDHKGSLKTEAGMEHAADKHMETSTVVGAAMADEQFSTLVTAVKAADLVDALSSEGPFTVFAPTNDAFAALPEGTLDDLLLPENKDKLAGILKYHVVPAKVMAGDIADGETMVDTLNGTQLKVVKTADGVTVNGAKVITADVAASNGVIHVLDSVVLPE